MAFTLAIPGPCFVQMHPDEVGNVVLNDDNVPNRIFVGFSSGGLRVEFRNHYKPVTNDIIGNGEPFDMLFTGSEATLRFRLKALDDAAKDDSDFWEWLPVGHFAERSNAGVRIRRIPHVIGTSMMLRHTCPISFYLPYYKHNGKTARLKFFRCYVVQSDVLASAAGYEYNLLMRALPVVGYGARMENHVVLFSWRYV